jgi:ABC-type transport system involved in cytochrome c biogenesis permease subunit
MAIDELPPVTRRPIVRLRETESEEDTQSLLRRSWPVAARILAPLASLKLTVALLLMSVFIVLAGTFAQTRMDIWDAIRGYFRIDLARAFTGDFPFVHWRELFVWIDLPLFFPASFFPDDPTFPESMGWLEAIWPTQADVRGLPAWAGIWFPRGWTIGVVMIANLLAAHTLRFKVQTRGTRLYAGLGVLALGVLVTWLIVMAGGEGAQSGPFLSYRALWTLLNFSMFLLAAPCVYFAITLPPEQRGVRWLLGISAALCGVMGGVMATIGPVAPESMRILYQLLQGSFAAAVLLVGCLLAFRKRAGIVLLHGGVGLMMAYEVLVGTSHVEMKMIIPEGEAATFAFDSRAVEFAVVDHSNPLEERQIVIDQSLIVPGTFIRDARLPFEIEVLRYEPNATFRPTRGDEQPVATRGFGAKRVLEPLARATGTESKQDYPAAVVRLWKKPAATPTPATPATSAKAGQPNPNELGTWLLSTKLDPALRQIPLVEVVEVPGTPSADAEPSSTPPAAKEYDFGLRFARHYKDYDVELIDVQKNDYAGTTHARDWRSVINLTTHAGSRDLDHYEIWMNNPLRYGDETFYQQEWAQMRDGTEVTTLQVVKNEGWMAPYVACMIVAAGMIYQFGLGFLRFIDRQVRGGGNALPSPGSLAADLSMSPPSRWQGWTIPAITATVLVLCLAPSVMRARKQVWNDYDLAAFGELPVIMGGRGLPLDSIAMNRLMEVSDLQAFKEKDPNPADDEEPKSQVATRWMLDMIARSEVADTYPVFRIENDTLAKSLGLTVNEARRYAIADFGEKLDLMREEMIANPPPKGDESVEQRKKMELMTRVSQYRDLQAWFSSAEPLLRKQVPSLFDKERTVAQKAGVVMHVVGELNNIAEISKDHGVPLVVPLHVGEADDSITRIERLAREWETYPVATGFRAVDEGIGAPPPPGIVKFQAILDAWKAQQPEPFNKAVADYAAFLQTATPEQLQVSTTEISFGKSRFEAYFNRLGPFNLLSYAYLVVLVLTLAGWGAAGFGWPVTAPTLQRTAFLTTAFLLTAHTLAIVGRIYISGRPPVTNLYSSAIFIGWAAVFMGLVFEGLSRLGLGNAVSAVSGFVTLRIAHALMTDGDTLAVQEAVLDTQFWLATHVVCITLGYAATYVAGLFGLMYILRGSQIGMITLGVLCLVASAVVGTSAGMIGLALAPIKVIGGAFALYFGIRRYVRDVDEFDATLQKILTRLTYGMLCAATLLSFVGTVLGGLWADDSWGRFWGWDPKENGALIIVLWNVMILHARWDRLIRDRGLAALAVLGNVVVSWSWFGVNELGIGLHTYGFTEGRLFWLMTFAASQVLIAALGLLPRSLWWGEAQTVAVPRKSQGD